MKNFTIKNLNQILVICLFNITLNAQCWNNVAKGNDNTIALKTNGTLWAWGNNSYGQLGDNTYYDKSTPIQIGSANNWQSLAAGASSSFGIKLNGTLWAWGNNNYRQLGDGTIIPRIVPTQIGTGTNWQSIAVGFQYTMAIKTDGTLWGWGRNDHGQLGDGTNINKLVPTQIGNASNWRLISTGFFHTIAIKTDNTLWAWGLNDDGQLGNGTVNNINIITQVGTANNWQTASAGKSHSVGIKTNGTLWGWGRDTSGQLGLGQFQPNFQYVPIQSGTATNWQSISAGYAHTIATKTNGTLWSWGLQVDGQLGRIILNGNNSTPTQIGLENNWSFISQAGQDQTLVLKNDNTLWACGDNDFGQLGDGTTIDKFVVTQVGCFTLSTMSVNENKSITLFPNPVTDILNVEIESNQIEKIIIFDFYGKKVIEQIYPSEQINVRSLQQGIYIIQIISHEKNFQCKFVKH